MAYPDSSKPDRFLPPNDTPPHDTPVPLEGEALLAFLQAWVVGITGMDGTLVRPRWQPEPPTIPDAGTCWAAIGVIAPRKADTFPYLSMKKNGSYYFQRMEQLTLLCSFYDLGYNGLADYYSTLLRDGTAIPQNNEVLIKNNFAFVACGDMQPVPTLFKSRWMYRVDLPITLNRQIERYYPVLNVEEGDGLLYANDGANTLTRTIVSKG